MTENASGADNQQERLIGWITGFVDGEGCFSIAFVKQPNRGKRIGYKTGYQVAHRFVVTQGISSRECLEDLQKFFGIGRLVINKRYDNHKEHLMQYIVDSRKDLMDIIIPFFRKYPLKTAKKYDFEKFALCIETILLNHHKTIDGLIKIAQVVQTMNRKQSKAELIRILRDQTPDRIMSTD